MEVGLNSQNNNSLSNNCYIFVIKIVELENDRDR